MDNSEFIFNMSEVQRECYTISKDHGFWAMPEDNHKAVKIALMHSELSELLEIARVGDHNSDHLVDMTAMEEECADVLIRLADFCERFGLRLGMAVLAKMQYNRSRPHKHGKLF